MAQVSWWMGDKKLEDGDRFNISKDLTGTCRLTIKKGEASDSGQVTCRLEKQEDKTTTNLTVVGEKNVPTLFVESHFASSFWRLRPETNQKRKFRDAYLLQNILS